jgi:hypothetical protein
MELACCFWVVLVNVAPREAEEQRSQDVVSLKFLLKPPISAVYFLALAGALE